MTPASRYMVATLSGEPLDRFGEAVGSVLGEIAQCTGKPRGDVNLCCTPVTGRFFSHVRWC